MPIKINGFEVPDEAISREAERLLEEVRKNMPWLDENAARFQSEDLAKDRIIEHRLLFEESQRSIPELTTEELDAEYGQIVKAHGGEKKFLEKFKIQANQIPGVKAEIQQDVRMNALIRQLNEQIVQPTEEDIKSYYDSHTQQFTGKTQYKASHIVLHTNQGQDPEAAKAKAEECLSRLVAGTATFEELADEVSDCPGKAGDLGWFADGYMVEEFEKEVFPLELGQRTDIFQTPFGFHIARLDDKKPGELEPFENVREPIGKHLVTESRNKIFSTKIDTLKKTAEIIR